MQPNVNNKVKGGRMAYIDICDGKLFTRFVCCFGFRFGTDLNG
jgi:hypothetical protein